MSCNLPEIPPALFALPVLLTPFLDPGAVDLSHGRPVLDTPPKTFEARTVDPHVSEADREALHEIMGLIKSGTPLDARDDKGYSALMHAAQKRQAGALTFLIQAGAPLDSLDPDGRGALSFATVNGDMVCLKILLDAGANPDVGCYHCSALAHASGLKDLDCLLLLISAGACVNARTKKGHTPLHTAALYGNSKALLALLAAGADIEATTFARDRTIHFAASGRPESAACLDVLISAGADLTALDCMGRTPAQVARDCGLGDLVQSVAVDVETRLLAALVPPPALVSKPVRL